MDNYTPNQLILPLFNEKHCLKCGKAFKVKPSHMDKRTYCSKACMGDHYQTRLTGSQNPNFRNLQEITCQHCGQSYTSYYKNSRFCSKPCHYASKRKPKLAKVKSVRVNLLTKTFKAYTCIECGIHFPASGNNVKRCVDCRAKYYDSLRRMRTCKNCGSDFWCEHENNRVTCSDACSAQWQSARQRGENSHFWQGGKTSDALIFRGLLDYDQWRKAVYERDDYTCQMCKERGGKLTAHHIKLFSKHEELRLHAGNGITLCWKCHTSIRHKEHQYEETFFEITGGI